MANIINAAFGFHNRVNQKARQVKLQMHNRSSEARTSLFDHFSGISIDEY